FELRAPAGASLRTALLDAVDGAQELLGFRPVLDTSGPVDSAIPDDIVSELMAVLREALTNVARHARATTARVSVTATADHVVLRVEDDGIGLGSALARGGLVNMTDRANDLGGTFEIGPGGSGTVLMWQVPIVG
ncbi:sensor histidine kinase, partial [Micromonosporaceae bacterium Da 78-11]